MNLTVEKVNSYNFTVIGEGVEAQVKYYDKWDHSVKGKGARKAKEQIIEAVQNFLYSEGKAYQAKKEVEQQEKIEAFRQSETFKNIDLLSLYNAEVFYYDSYHREWMNYNKLLTGAEAKSKYDYVISAEKVEIKNTDIYKIEVQKSIAVVDERIISVGGELMGKMQLVTGLTLKEKLLTGLKSYGNIRKAHDVELRMLEQLGNINKTAFILGDEFDLTKELNQAERYQKEITRANEAFQEPIQPIKFNKDGQQIKFAWFISKPCQFKDLEDLYCATYEEYVTYETMTVNKETFDQFKNSFDMSILGTEFSGGTYSDMEIDGEFYQLTDEQQGEYILNSWNGCIEVKCNEYNYSLLVNPEGYTYGRYVAVLGEIPTTPDNNNTNKNKTNENINIEVVEVAEVISEPLTAHNSEQFESLATFETGTGSKGNGIEITFTEKPSEETRKLIKSVGYKWAGKNRPSIWWAINNDDTLNIAQQVCNVVENDNNSNDVELPTIEDFTPIIEAQTEPEMDLQFFSDVPTLDDVLNAFDTVDTAETTNNTITAEDRIHLEEMQSFYNRVKLVLEGQKEIILGLLVEQRENNFELINKYKDMYSIEDRLKEIKESFIHKAIRHFKKKYNIEVDSYKIVGKYKDIDINIDIIISELLETMNGLTFAEMASEQIKNDMKKSTSSKSTVKNNKVTLPSFLYMDSIDEKYGTLRLSYHCHDKLEKLIKAFTHYNNLEPDTLKEFANELRQGKNHEIIKEHELNLNKVKSMKLYKNGRLDIQFSNNDTAKKFFNEYVQ